MPVIPFLAMAGLIMEFYGSEEAIKMASNAKHSMDAFQTNPYARIFAEGGDHLLRILMLFFFLNWLAFARASHDF